MNFNPILPTPLTDFEYLIQPNFCISPYDKFCSKIQLKHADCMEAYGVHKGSQKCAELFYDLLECTQGYIQVNFFFPIILPQIKNYMSYFKVGIINF